MEWRIRESERGGFVAERGADHKGGVAVPCGVGCGVGFTMPAFIVYESARFNTRREAERYIEERSEQDK